MTQAASLKIILTAEGGLTGSWAFDSPADLLVGRSETAAVRPVAGEAAQSLSRRHAAIELSASGAILRDLGAVFIARRGVFHKFDGRGVMCGHRQEKFYSIA